MQGIKQMTVTPMSSYIIKASHQAYGTVEFRFAARDKKHAFEQFKGIVFSVKQWILQSNEPE